MGKYLLGLQVRPLERIIQGIRKKGMWMKVLSRVMIVVGILLLCIPVAGKFYNQYQQEKMYQAYLAQMAALEQQEVTEEVPVEEKQFDVGNEKVVGRIIIDKIGVDVLVVEGAQNAQLRVGAGHMLETALPGEVGNCVIAGHRSHPYADFFKDFDQLVIGDEVVLMVGQEEYRYSINDIFLTTPDDGSVIKQNKQGKEITLITCDPVVKPTHRLIVKGELTIDN